MKKSVCLAACVVCGTLIFLLVFAMILPSVILKHNESQIIGTWYMDGFEGKGGQYATFDKSGTVNLYTEVAMADGTVISQDYNTLGNMTYQILDRDTIRFSITVMGATSVETISYELKDHDTLILAGDSYTRFAGLT